MPLPPMSGKQTIPILSGGGIFATASDVWSTAILAVRRAGNLPAVGMRNNRQVLARCDAGSQRPTLRSPAIPERPGDKLLTPTPAAPLSGSFATNRYPFSALEDSHPCHR